MQRKKLICFYNEFNSKSDESVKKHLRPLNSEIQEKVIQYLKNGTDDGICCTCVYDHIKAVKTNITNNLYTDGEYIWNEEMIYHFKNYGLELEPEFIAKATS